YGQAAGAHQARKGMDLLVSGRIHTYQMTSHRFPFVQAADAFDLLFQHPDEAFGVLLDWGE
ncbi:MAG TPA: hypothetical protein DIT99_22640, partial [Candidatus Latescibacteria bacterium]|nr:hypothetical protein [Candidatus Latescibacterota bacterium]